MSIEIKCNLCHKTKKAQEFVPNRVFKTGYAGYCLDCDIRYYSGAYIKRVKKGKRYEASLVVSLMKRTGQWHQKPCEKCGSTSDIEGHHDDYNKPKEVRWLCKFHHLEHHKLINVKAMVIR